MAKLTGEQQIFIVDELAMWGRPQETADAFFERFGVRIERDQVAKYHPEGANSKLSAKLRERFWSRRKEFAESVDTIPIANRAYRVRKMQQMLDRAIDTGNRQQAMALLEQAAKETGGHFTNEMKVKHGGKVKTDRAMSPEELKMALADALTEALEKGQG